MVGFGTPTSTTVPARSRASNACLYGCGRVGLGDLRALAGVHQRLLGERPDAERRRQLGAVLEGHLLARVEGVEAVPRPAAPAGPALAAHRAPVQDDEVARRHGRHAL